MRGPARSRAQLTINPQEQFDVQKSSGLQLLKDQTTGFPVNGHHPVGEVFANWNFAAPSVKEKAARRRLQFIDAV